MKQLRTVLLLAICIISVRLSAESIYTRNKPYAEDKEIETVLLPFNHDNENPALGNQIRKRLFDKISEFEYSTPSFRNEQIPGSENGDLPVSSYTAFFTTVEGTHPEFIIKMKLTKRVEKIQIKEKTTFKKYIIENKKNEYFTVEFTFMDLFNDKVLETYRKEITEKEYQASVDEFSETIRKYYKPRVYKVSDRFPVATYASTSVSMIFPIAEYADTASMGTGIRGAYFAENIFFNNAVVSPSAALYYYTGTAPDINLYSSLNADVGFGYAYYNLLMNNSKLLVLARTGYMFHFISYTTENKIFMDPYLSPEVIFNHAINDRFDLTIGTAVGTFFEISNPGFFLQLIAGVSYVF